MKGEKRVMNKFIQKAKAKLKKTATGLLAALVTTTVISLPTAVTTVYASDGLDVNSAISKYINVTSSGAHYSFDGGNNFDVIMTGTKEQLIDVGLDCTAGAVTIAAHALRDAGADPYEYFGMLNGVLNNAYPPALRTYFENSSKWTTVANSPVDSSVLLPGDLLIYGSSGAGHMAIYTGGGQVFDFRSNGHGSTGNYRGYAAYSTYSQTMNTSSGGPETPLTGVYRANVDKNVTINLTKTSANADITDGLVNAYSLEGAKYEIYSDSAATNKIGEITTGSDGKGSTTVTVGFSTSTVYYKEVTSPKGYVLDSTVKAVGFSGTTAEINTSDKAGNDPLAINLTKKSDMVDGENPASLAGAQFTIKYYDLDSSQDYTAEQLAGMKVERTWIIETKEVTSSGGKKGYIAYLNDSCLVDGSSELYKDELGKATIPVGVISITETKEPSITYTDENGNQQLVYTLNNKTLDANGNEVLSSNGTVVMKVTGSNTTYTLIGGNDYTVKETPNKGGFYTTKVDDETGKAEGQGNATLDDAYYEVYNDNDYQVSSAQVTLANKGEKIWSYNTANGGVYSAGLDSLQVGRYIVREINPSTGYQVAGTTEQTLIVNKNAQTFLSGDKTFTEKVIRGGFMFQKNDYDTGTYAQGNTNLQATLKIINTSTNPVWVDSNGDGQFSEDEYYANGATIKLPQSYVKTGTANTADGTFTTDENGYFETVDYALPYGSYKIVEVTAPTGFAMDGNSVTETTFDITTNGQMADKRYDIKDEVFTGKFDIQKMLTSTNNGMSTTMKPEEGVEFTALLKATVDEKFGGDYKAAYEAIFGFAPNVEGNPTPDDSDVKRDADGNILFTTKEYDVITTNKSGMAYSRDLAYGEYYIFQSSHADSIIDYEGNVADYDGAIFNVTEKNQATKHYYVANHHQLYTLKMTKTSLQTGEKIELTNAKFKIKDADGNYVTQKVGNKTYDTFSTVTRKMIVDSADGKKINVETGTFVTENPSEDDAGVAYTALGVEGGTYYVTEVQTPDGFTKLEEPIEIVVKESSITEKDSEGTNFVDTEVKNTQITGTLNITKKFTQWEEADVQLYDLSEIYQKIGFTLTAKEDIINPADGKVLVKAGDQAVRLTGDRSNPYETVEEIFLDAEGNASVDGLPMGSYTLTETTAPDNVVVSDPQDIVFEQEDGNVKKAVYEVMADVTNEFTKTSFKKTDVAGEEIADAEMSITDSEGNVVDSWISDGTAHNVEGLSIGKTYYLNEDLAPLGMVKANSIAFTVDETGAVSTETMVDKIYTASKVDVAGEEVKGAQMTVTDEEGNVVDEWESDGTEHKIENLEEGKTYTISETVTAEGFVKATDITFTVKGADEDGNKENEHLDVVDKIVTTSKVDMGGEEVKGAEMSVTDEEGNEVDSWISDGSKHNIANLEENKKYTLHEVVAPEGYVKATDIEFTVTGADEEGVKVDQTVDMTDKTLTLQKLGMCGENVEGAEITVYETDENGNKIEDAVVDKFVTTADGNYHVSNLVAGKTYIASETVVPEGYAKALDHKFTVADDGKDQTEAMTNKLISISKVDAGGQEIEGAKLTLTDKETGEIVDSWTSTTETHYPTGVEVGKTYVLSEDTAPLGYIKSTTVEFTVTDNGVDQKVYMVDEIHNVTKTDGQGNQVNGAVLEVLDSEGNVVDTWTTGQHIVDIATEDVTTLQKGETVTYESEDGTITKIIPVVKKTTTDEEEKATVTNGSTDADKDACEVTPDTDKEDKKDEDSKSETAEYTYTAMITKADGTVSYYDVDLEGNETSHRVQNEVAGETYKIHEVSTVNGYYFSEDMDATITEDGMDQTTVVVDKPVDYYIEKIDDKGNSVKGVTLELTDITKNEKGEYVNTDEEGNPAKVELPNGGVTTGEKFHLVNQLVAGHSYALDETEIVAGVYKTNRIEFTVDYYNPATDEAITITMVDATTAVSVRKVDESGKAVADAKMQIIETTTDEEGNVVAAKNEDGTDKVVYEFTTTDAEEGTDVSDKVVGGETYILREDEAPFGFDKVEDRVFTVTGEAGVYQVLVVKDNHSKEYIKAEKVDSSDASKKLAGAELELYNAKTNKLVAKGTTGSDGTVTWEVKWNDDNGGYYIKEAKAPTGYKKTDDKFTVSKATEDTGFTKDAAVVVTIKNDKDKSLGVSIPLVAGGMMIIAIAGLYIVISRKKETSK